MTDKDAMERIMEYSEPKIGDVYLVPAKTVHAIGAGCLILEVQEPTDYTIQPEHWCDEYELSDDEMYIGLSDGTNGGRIPLYVQKLEGWKNKVTYHERLKPSYYILQSKWRGKDEG